MEVVTNIVIMKKPNPEDDLLLEHPEDNGQRDAGLHFARNKQFYTLWKKKDIVQEACSPTTC
jgi:hypothetical protein